MDEPVTPICAKKRDRPISSEECDFKVTTKISELRKQKQQTVSKKVKFDAHEEMELIVINAQETNENQNKDTNEKGGETIKTNSDNKQNSEKVIKLIVSNHGIETKNLNKEYINKHVTKTFSIINTKESFKNKNILICTIKTEDIEKAIDRNSWSVPERDIKIVVDRKSNQVKSLCINKIYNEQKDQISMYLAKYELDKLGLHFNLRKENNLFVFETTNDHTRLFEEQEFTLDTTHTIRIYDPIENYIEQCKKCFKIGHITATCKTKFLCPWCSNAACYKKCDENKRKCTNCDGNHSSLYKGCKVYKAHIQKAQKHKEEKNKEENVKKIKKSTENLQKNLTNLQMSMQVLSIHRKKLKSTKTA